jgi:hypothetical protein
VHDDGHVVAVGRCEHLAQARELCGIVELDVGVREVQLDPVVQAGVLRASSSSA